GVLVLQSSFPSNEVSGFSLNDTEKNPVILLNSRDVHARRTFTLAHEYAHILLGSVGICKPKSTSKEVVRDHSVEAFCDKFAAALLVPSDIFLSLPGI